MLVPLLIHARIVAIPPLNAHGSSHPANRGPARLLLHLGDETPSRARKVADYEERYRAQSLRRSNISNTSHELADSLLRVERSHDMVVSLGRRKSNVSKRNSSRG